MDLYVNLDHAAYKTLEKAMREFRETVHTSVEGFYHKSIRLRVGDATFEFTGPAVKAPIGGELTLRSNRRKGPADRRVQFYAEGARRNSRRLGVSDRRKKQRPRDLAGHPM